MSERETRDDLRILKTRLKMLSPRARMSVRKSPNRVYLYRERALDPSSRKERRIKKSILDATMRNHAAQIQEAQINESRQY